MVTRLPYFKTGALLLCDTKAKGRGVTRGVPAVPATQKKYNWPRAGAVACHSPLCPFISSDIIRRIILVTEDVADISRDLTMT